MRKDLLCSGGDGPLACPDSLKTSNDGVLECAERCDGCLLNGLEDAFGRTATGHLLNSVIDIDSAGEWGFQMNLEDITARQFSALKILKLEKQRHQAEQDKKQRENASNA